MAFVLGSYWQISFRAAEAEYWLGRIGERFPSPTLGRAQVLLTRSNVLAEDVVDGAKEGIEIAERLGADALAARGYLYLTGSLLQDASTREEARRVGEKAEERLQALGDRFGLLWLHVELAGMHGFAGEPGPAIARCEQGLRLAAGSGEVWATSYLHQFMGFALFQLDENKAAAAALHQALTMKHELDEVIGIAYTLEMAAWLAARQRRHERAAWLLGAASGLMESSGEQTFEDHVFLIEPHRNAVESTRGAVGADGYTALYQAGYDYPLGQLIPLVTGDADQLPQASLEPAAPDGAGPLTSREREIAILVAEGLSNREIAERLVISKRTVDAHVEHTYTKLGISSRVQLTNWLKDFLS